MCFGHVLLYKCLLEHLKLIDQWDRSQKFNVVSTNLWFFLSRQNVSKLILKSCDHVIHECLFTTVKLKPDRPNCRSNLSSSTKWSSEWTERESAPAPSQEASGGWFFITATSEQLTLHDLIKTLQRWSKINTRTQGQVFLWGSPSQGHDTWCRFCCKQSCFFQLNKGGSWPTSFKNYSFSNSLKNVFFFLPSLRCKG